jgi:Na+/glutamate symporter
MELPTTSTEVASLIAENPAVALGVAAVAGAAVGSVATGIIVAKVKKRKKKSKKKSKKSTKKSKRKSKRKLKFGSKAYRKKYLGKHKHRRKQRQPHTAGKRKDTSTRRIRYTKNNQPYVILASGKARFIKRSSVRRSRKMKGGRY